MAHGIGSPERFVLLVESDPVGAVEPPGLGQRREPTAHQQRHALLDLGGAAQRVTEQRHGDAAGVPRDEVADQLAVPGPVHRRPALRNHPSISPCAAPDRPAVLPGPREPSDPGPTPLARPRGAP
ncbi:MAG: hypothetical protein AVDCRST_MAG48-3070 [uncultured Friedmanniella sp.]|uniref:Uncharacterized protein n=1 Tax=uncultured Friedmanniella sp. TaxID=335381 RepID=A0A6J4LEL9_9ACTN|nr:MAG: hypothetical protein AVDCRST_MAG48-3070 [uncultured Friedmanniella sp.]